MSLSNNVQILSIFTQNIFKVMM